MYNYDCMGKGINLQITHEENSFDWNSRCICINAICMKGSGNQGVKGEIILTMPGRVPWSVDAEGKHPPERPTCDYAYKMMVYLHKVMHLNCTCIINEWKIDRPTHRPTHKVRKSFNCIIL